jgi:predicted GNAT family N-acyltransferase
LRIVEITHDSDAYREVVALRYEVLRRPLGLTFSPEQLSAERDSIHLAAYDDTSELLGCLLLTPGKDGYLKMRQVAVRADKQRSGVGVALVQFSERLAKERGYQVMILSARETAVPFYLKLGYLLDGELFEEVTLPHRMMKKTL